MNSSGIKRGLAGSAVAALAVTGLPFLASSADAAAGDTITVVSTGPARNGGDQGAVVVLRVKDGTVIPANLKLTATDDATANSQNNSNQSATIVDHSSPVDDKSDAAYELITLNISTTTANTGDTASFRVFEDEATPTANDKLDASEPRANVSIATSGAVSKVEVAPSSQSTAQGIESGAYTVTVKDSAGRTTQLNKSETVALSTDAQITLNPNTYVPADDNGTPGDTSDDTPASGSESAATLDSDDLELGDADFTATPDGNADKKAHTITVDGPGSADTSATLNVTAAAALTKDMVDIVTGADSWDGFGDGANNGTTSVRVDQSSVRIDIKGGAGNAGATVTLNVTGDKADFTPAGATDVTFGGKKSTTVTTVLDSEGNGSLTITPDALSVQEGDKVGISGSFNQTLKFERSAPSIIEASQDPYFAKRGGSVDVTVTVTDQFGEPVTTGFIGAKRTAGPNSTNDAQQAKPVDSTGSATFTFADAKATDGDPTDTVTFGYVKDQFQNPATANPVGQTHIKWTTDGQGANFVTSIGGDSTEAPTYDPTKETVVPLADAKDDEPGEDLALAVSGVENNATVTISVDNGALILAPGKTDLSDGKSSVSVDLVGQSLPNGYRLVGTKAGTVTVTTSATNRTETAQFTVSAQNDKSTARNVTVSGPAEVEHGTTQIPFTAVVTDAFGNPVANVPVTDLNIQVTGPAQFQDSDAVTNANGQLNLNVRVDADAEGDVTIKVQGFGEQFGAAADQLTSSSPANSAKGLPASSNVGTATTMVKAGDVTPPVENPVLAHMKVKGIDKGKRDVIRVDAIDAASGAKVTLFKRKANGSLKRIKAAELNEKGNFTFRVHDGNGAKATRYTVKLQGNDAVRPANKSRRVK